MHTAHLTLTRQEAETVKALARLTLHRLYAHRFHTFNTASVEFVRSVVDLIYHIGTHYEEAIYESPCD